MTEFLTVEQVIALHDEESNAFLRDRGLLEGAVGQPQQTVGGQWAYPSLVAQAARLAYGINKAQAFMDGNKRCAWLACTTFLGLNGVEVGDVPAVVAAEVMEAVGDSSMRFEELVLWLISVIE